MPEILLVRHGPPLCDHHTRIRGCDFARWVETYDNAPLDTSRVPDAELRARVAEIPYVVTSTLRRAIESASLVAPERSATSDPLFNEAGIPTEFRSRLRLRPTFWDAIARAAWMLGWAGEAESARDAALRAGRAAHRLVALAETHRAVVLFGHGMLNTLIARALRRAGWSGRGSVRAYWGRVTLRSAA